MFEVCIFMLRKILIWLLKLFGLYEDKSDTPTPSMTEYERRIYSILLKLGDDYKIIPQKKSGIPYSLFWN